MTPKNGYVPTNLLVAVEGLLLARDTAAAYLRMKAAAATQGVTIAIARPAGAYRTFAVQADMHVHPELYNLDPTSKAGLAAAGHSGHGLGNRVDIGTGRTWAIEHAAEFGFDREFGANDPGHFRFAAETWPGDGSAPTSTPAAGWHPGQTDFTGGYGEKELHGARWYVIEPATTAAKTIAGVVEAHGLALSDVTAWTTKVAASKWGGHLLQAGSSWWNGGPRYFAGVCIALNDVAAILDAYEAQVIAQQTETTPAVTPSPAPAPVPAKKVSPPKPARLTPAQAEALAASIAIDPTSAPDAGITTPLSGLFAGHDQGRKVAYLIYSGTSLVLSFGSDVIMVGLLTAHQATVLGMYVSLATSILSKIGVAVGFMAASNTVKN